jgi:hypothetical protein
MSEFEWIDDCFRVEAHQWGTSVSYDRDGKSLVTALTEQECISATRFYLKGKQEGWGEIKTYDGTISGKL